MTRPEANELLLARDKYWLSKAKSKALEQNVEISEDGFEDEYNVIHEMEEAEDDELWGCDVIH